MHENFLNRSRAIRQDPFLAEPGAAFVTLTKNRRLRGCIGSLRANGPLIDDIVSNARSAAFKDSRFPPLQFEEFSDLSFEVSVLSPPETIRYDTVEALEKIVIPYRDGIILSLGDHRATFLPQVWEQMKGFDEFFAYLCRKAGLDGGCLALHPAVQRYRVRAYSESALSKRPMNNAGIFYPKRCSRLIGMFEHFENRAANSAKPLSHNIPRALIVPHAGYRYSGYTADLVYRAARRSRAKRVIVLGPSHRVYFKGISGAAYDALKTPCGLLGTDKAYLKKLKGNYPIGFVRKAHESEHSTEVQFPFIYRYLPLMPVVELIYGDVDEKVLRSLVDTLLKNPKNLLIVSTDLSHYFPIDRAHQLDYNCLDAVRELDPKKLKHCKACGKAGLSALLSSGKTLGLRSELIDYRTSADATGDKKKVVGYMGAMMY